MTQPDRLSGDEILIRMNTVTVPRQEWDSMKRENEQLRRLLKPCQHSTQDNISFGQTEEKNICRDCLTVIDYANKESDNG